MVENIFNLWCCYNERFELGQRSVGDVWVGTKGKNKEGPSWFEQVHERGDVNLKDWCHHAYSVYSPLPFPNVGMGMVICYKEKLVKMTWKHGNLHCFVNFLMFPNLPDAHRYILYGRYISKRLGSKKGQSEQPPTIAPSIRRMLLLGCGWTSTELIFGFTLVTNSIQNRVSYIGR
jgi:hypothetical protein